MPVVLSIAQCFMFRMTILPTVDELKVSLERLREFHARFMSKYT